MIYDSNESEGKVLFFSRKNYALKFEFNMFQDIPSFICHQIWMFQTVLCIMVIFIEKNVQAYLQLWS